MRCLLAFALVAASPWSVLAQEAGDKTTFPSAADASWDSLALLQLKGDALPKFTSKELADAWVTVRYRGYAAGCLWFYQQYPGDERRYEAAFHYLNLVLSFIPDTTAEERRHAEGMLAHLESSENVPSRWRERIAGFGARLRVETLLYSRESPNVDAVRRELDKFARQYPQSELLGYLERGYVELLAKGSQKAADQWLTHLHASPNESVQKMSAGLVRERKLLREPLDIRFTALDGRKVDFTDLRGKIVLVDFWATWCGPCVAELPHIKAVYDEFHERGFEIVGISLDHEKDRQKLIDFVRENSMPWPQHFDGKGWKNEFAARYAISGIPAQWLLDRNGIVVEKEIRGAELGRRVGELISSEGMQ